MSDLPKVGLGGRWAVIVAPEYGGPQGLDAILAQFPTKREAKAYARAWHFVQGTPYTDKPGVHDLCKTIAKPRCEMSKLLARFYGRALRGEL